MSWTSDCASPAWPDDLEPKISRDANQALAK